MPNRNQGNSEADICLLLEGTFPYVRGGVSSWVKQLIEGLPDYRFSIVYLGADRDSAKEYAYELPDNVVHIETHFLMDNLEPDKSPVSIAAKLKSWSTTLAKRKHCKEAFRQSDALHADMLCEGPLSGDLTASFTQLLCGANALTAHALEQHPLSWQSITRQYHNAPEGLDFNHYFWTVRSMHAPVFRLAEIARQAPSARIYHSVSTGYAGFLGGLLKNIHDVPYIITEHGIYTKERELDLAQVEWIPEQHDPFKVGLDDNMSYLRQVWIRFFSSLGRMAYSCSEEVFTLHKGNERRQIADGADPERLTIIPNGVNVARFAAGRRTADAAIPPVIALIGRIVPIKDIKTFIRAIQIISSRLPEVQGWLVGPDDEAPDYTRECRELVASLGLSNQVIFKGFQKPDDVFPQIGLCALTSVSEGQPLVILEGYAAGIPSLTTDVGSCRELAQGNCDADRALGQSGEIVPISDPGAFASAALRMLGDPALWRSASESAIRRVETYYDEKTMIASYDAVYRRHLQVDKSIDGSSDSTKAA